MEDEVMATYPLLLSTHLAPYLHTIHNPPALHPDDGCAAVKCRIKPKHGWLWLETPTDPHHLTVDRQRAADFSRAAAAASSSGLSVDMSRTRAFVGDIEHGALDRFVLVRTGDSVILTPIHGHIDIRPSLLGVDLVSAERAQASPSLPAKRATEAADPSAEQKIMPTFQKRETEEQQQARLSSYDHLHKVWEEEPWTGATFFPSHLDETVGISRRLVDGADAVDCNVLPTHGTVAFMRNVGILKGEDVEESE